MLSDDIEFNHASSYSITADECENVWLNISTKTSEKYLVGLIYRHSNSKANEFIEKINHKLQKASNENVKCIVIGEIHNQSNF